MNVLLLGIGAATPAASIKQDDAAAMASLRCCRTESQSRALTRIYGRAGVESRGCGLLEPDRFYPPGSANDHAGGDSTQRGPTTATRMREFRRIAPALAIEAAAAALTDSGIAADQITHLIVATCTGFASPGVEIALIKTLGLAPTVRRIQLGFMGCHAGLNGLQVATAIGRSDPAARTLVCCVELCSLHFQYGWHAESIVANSLFADGAAAMIVGAAEPPTARQWRIAGSATNLINGTQEQMSWHIGDHGFVMTLSARVPQILAEHLRPWLDDWLRTFDLAVDDVASWAIHAGGPRIVDAVVDRLSLPGAAVEHTRHVLRRHGNMSSATVPFILRRLREHDARTPCVALSFGPGLVAEAALLLDGGGGRGRPR